MLKTIEGSENYTATVVRINMANSYKPVNLDRLVGIDIFGNRILIPKTTKDGTLGLFFPPECSISPKFLSYNNLYSTSELNREPSKKGFFGKNGRVKAVQFQGNPSSGMFISLESLSYLGNIPTLKEGDSFNKIGDEVICVKYVPVSNTVSSSPSNPKVKGEKSLIQRVNNSTFVPHYNTEHLLKNLHKLEIEDDVVITVKIHGTSVRFGNNLVHRKFSSVEKFLKKFKLNKYLNINIQSEEYLPIVGSRNQIKAVGNDINKHVNAHVSSAIPTVFSLDKGETIYGEAYGNNPYGNKPIQPKYSYGAAPLETKLAVYRITRTNPDGITYDLTWNQVKIRCKELGIEHVPEVFSGKLSDFIYKDVSLSEMSKDWREILSEKIKGMLEKDSIFSNDSWRMPEEGFVLTYYRGKTAKSLKAKSFRFNNYESMDLDERENSEEVNEEE